jgi:quercetin dioxygenase-like cupin family protein
MPSYKKLNFADVEDLAPGYGMGEICEARFARGALGAERIGVTCYHMKPGRRVGFGHSHPESEETYVVINGSGRFRVQDDVFDVGPRDVVYCPVNTMREWEAGSDGMELLAFGAHTEGESTEMKRDFWPD